ncbi:MAG: nucleotide pyrophosphohydrolase [Candidatus Lokiarchaeota archaeon]|nr:nucleotide pyrophosphohydrolase [Candidatus Lokiarchaeota archaeon]
MAAERDIDSLRDALRRFVAERQWERFHEPKDLALAISIEASELAEHFLWKGVDEARGYVREGGHLDEVIEEVADVIIYSLNLMNALERISGKHIDVAKAILDKVGKNAAKYPADAYRNKARLEKP